MNKHSFVIPLETSALFQPSMQSIQFAFFESHVRTLTIHVDEQQDLLIDRYCNFFCSPVRMQKGVFL